VLSRRGNAISINNSIVKDFRRPATRCVTGPRRCTPAPTRRRSTGTPPVGIIQSTLFNNNGPTGTTPGAQRRYLRRLGAGRRDLHLHHDSALRRFSWPQKNVLDTTDGSIAAIGGGTFPPAISVPAAGLAGTHPRGQLHHDRQLVHQCSVHRRLPTRWR
jgi:hypothetical protein